MESERDSQVRVSSARMFELLLDWFPDVIQSVDDQGVIVYANRRAAELLGYSREALLGLHVRDLYAPEVWPQVERGFARLKSEGQLTVTESLIRDRAGNRIPVEIRSFGVYDDDGRFLRTFSILRDQRQLRELTNRLQHSSRLAAIGELAACIVHDISNPLAVIRLYTELLQTQAADLKAVNPETVADLEESLANVARSLDKIQRLINHLREFSRSRDSLAETVDLRRVLEDALFMVQNRIAAHAVRVTCRFPPEPCCVQGNASQLEQAFMNLCANACDAMEGVPEAVLDLALAESTDPAYPEHWECRVSDSGVGMTREVLEHVFTPFFTTKPREQGTGLGLSICRSIVRRHGGHIALTSEVGRGTTFRVCLPRAAGGTATPAAP